MNLPFFYLKEFSEEQTRIALDEETSKHVVQVLRMKKGERLHLTNGKGTLLTVEITSDHKKHCEVSVVDSQFKTRGSDNYSPRKISVAMSLLKNASRFEWFLEKATEIGIDDIILLLCERTERQKFREDRMQNILISAMLQSQQCWLPRLHRPMTYELLFRQDEIIHCAQKFIAHCGDEPKRNLADLVNESLPSQVILVGPEGDFTPAEVRLALQNHFDAVSLGGTRLRSETAAIVAATLLKLT